MHRTTIPGIIALLTAGTVSVAAAQATFTVNSTGNSDDAAPGDGVCADGGGACTLRAAVDEANAKAGLDSIHFNIPGTGPFTIVTGAPYIDITDPLVIDGYTQPGASPNTNALGTGLNTVFMITLDQGCPQFRVDAPGSIIRGLRLSGPVYVAADNDTIRGNEISTAVPNSGSCAPADGVEVIGNDAVIGGTTPESFNVISGQRWGIALAAVTGADMRGNYIGTDVDGTTPIPNVLGIRVGGAQGALIAGNTIAFNDSTGVLVTSGNGIQILENSIYDNGRLGIDLGGDGVTANDATDADAGPNGLQNFPVITGAWASPAAPGLAATFQGAPNRLLRLDFYASSACDPSGYGEGARHILTQGAFTNGVGAGSMVDSTALAISAGEVITATATDNATDNTSEFSACVTVERRTPFVVNTTDDVYTGTCSAAHCSLREAIYAANQRPGADSIHFAIPGAGLHTIQPARALPQIVDPVVIDGYTQPGAVPNADPLDPGSNAVLAIELDGSHTPSPTWGLLFYIHAAVLRGLVINRFPGAQVDLWDGPYTVEGNFIGTDASGRVGAGAGGTGIVLENTSHEATIGGPDPGAGNVIAFNGGAGVLVLGAGNTIQGNRIHDNGRLGIDLGGDGVTANDATDADAGANGLQNFPVLSAAFAGSAVVGGSLNSVANNDYRLEFYTNSACDASGHGEGALLLGDTTVTTDGGGNVTFLATLPGAATPGDFVTATATDPAGNTSEFSACVRTTGFTIVASPDTLDVRKGESGTYTVRVNPDSGSLTDPMTLGCTGLPPETSCAFSPATVIPGDSGATSTLTLSTTTAATAAPPASFMITASAGPLQGMAGAAVRVIDFALTASTAKTTIHPGASAAVTLTVKPVGDRFGQPVSLACSDAVRVSCAFSSTTVTPGAGSATSTLTVSAPASAAASTAALGLSLPQPPRSPAWRWTLVTASLLLLGLGAMRGRKPRRRLLTAAASAGLLALACGGQTTGPPQGFTETVAVTATSGSLAKTVSVAVTVQ